MSVGNDLAVRRRTCIEYSEMLFAAYYAEMHRLNTYWTLADS